MMQSTRIARGLLLLVVPLTAQGQPTVSESSTPRAPANSATTPANSATTVPGTPSSVVPTGPLMFRAGSDVADANAAALPSSARPSSNIESSRDGFDLNSASRDNTVRGSKGAFALTGQTVRAVSVPDIHTVRRGDTLWDLCGHYLGNSWDWPRIWSYNPDIRNPNWIYPGDQIRMRQGAVGMGTGAFPSGAGDATSRGPGGGNRDNPATLFGGGSRALPDTVFLRNEAYIEDPDKDVIGEVVGAKEEQMLLGQGNHVYLDVKPNVELKVGQQLTLFEQSRKPEPVDGARQPPGEIILIKGTLRVEDFDAKRHVARAEILESADAIERGIKVGAVGRRYIVVPPKPSKATVWAHILTGIYPHVYMGSQQLVFIDRGSEDGLVNGNRLLVIRRGDLWRRSLDVASRGARYRMRVDLPGNAEMDRTQLKREDQEFPEEITGELRLVNVLRWSSLALVTASHRELMAGDRAVAREGY